MSPKTAPKQNKGKRKKSSPPLHESRDNTEAIVVIGVVVYTVIFVICCMLLIISRVQRQLPIASVVEEEETYSGSVYPADSSTPIKMKVSTEGNSESVMKVLGDDDRGVFRQDHSLVRIKYGKYEDTFFFQCVAPPGIKAPLLRNGSDLVVLDGGSFYTAAHFANSDTVLGSRKYGEESFMKLCARGFEMGITSVTGFDIKKAVGSSVLSEMLRDLQETGTIASLPLAAIVTPGESSALLAEWISYGDIGSLADDFARHWITVSSHLEEIEEDFLRSIGSWPVLALHGADDPAGKETARVLATKMNVETQTLPGGPDCFIDHSDEFVSSIMDYLRKRIM